MQSSTLPFELRVHALESRIFGLDHAGQPSAGPSSTRNIQRRIQDIEEALERASQSSDALKRLIEGYQQYLPLLKLADHQPRNEDDAPAQAIRESDLLPDSTKLTMVMEAAGDIKHAERVLRDIELLKKQEVEGSGQLHELLPYRGQLISGIQEEKENSVDLRNTRKEVNELLRRYNDFTTTVSELFLELHHRIEIMEESVAREERKRRKAQASRF